ncbi:hypothetical protein [Evansella tamaricis]|uniref:NADH dehydrogenase subunit 6 n=1 Tax=Evansella tamaricis TaxID=2069301 RepID=A0ABS6JH04_9BACI|nr:hypothetical protein [Evansella tamaricis]MBU9712132.1 hypothetical protein [Evansella tamaricis]
MQLEIMIVFLGIGLFLLAGLFGGLGIYFFLKKNRRVLSAVFMGIGFLLIVVYIISLLMVL